MARSKIRAFEVSASGVTIKNLCIKNAYDDVGGAIYFTSSAFLCTVENCTFTNNKATQGGGAIYFTSSFLCTVENCTFTNNTAYDGGAVYFLEQGIVTNCTFTNNTASDDMGGAIWIDSGYVTNCTFTNNTAWYGGAVYFKSNGEVTNCTFTNNNASAGGAVHFKTNGEVTNCNFTKNTAYYSSGGAIWIDSGNVANCNFTNNKVTSIEMDYCGGAIRIDSGNVTNCTFTKNTASHGGAIRIDSGNVTNCTFIKNTAYDGGAIWIYSSKGTVENCNFVSNSANCGGGIFSNNRYTSADTCIFKTGSDDNVNVTIFPPRLNVDDFTCFYGSGEKIAFDLKTNISSKPMDNGNISISVYCKNNDSWVGNYSCLSGEEWAVDLPVGSYYAIYNTEYAGFKAINRTITISLPDIQYYANVTPVTGNSKTVNITAKSNIPGNLFVDGKLIFILPNSMEISANYTEDGTWWAVYEFDDYGDYEIKASYVEIDNVIINNATISLRNIVPINLDDTSAPYGNVTILVNVSEAINGQNITIAVNESSANATVENGQAKATFADLPVGEYVITVEYLGDGYNAGNSTTAKLTVNKLKQALLQVQSLQLTMWVKNLLSPLKIIKERH